MLSKRILNDSGSKMRDDSHKIQNDLERRGKLAEKGDQAVRWVLASNFLLTEEEQHLRQLYGGTCTEIHCVRRVFCIMPRCHSIFCFYMT